MSDEERHCDGCGEDYDPFEESHVGHEPMSDFPPVVENYGGGCDCTELCSMGPTCPGGMLAEVPGSGCWRTEQPFSDATAPLAAAQGQGELTNEQYDALETAVMSALESTKSVPDTRWVEFTYEIQPVVARMIADAEQRGREDNEDHGMCYVHGSKALEERDRVMQRLGRENHDEGTNR